MYVALKKTLKNWNFNNRFSIENHTYDELLIIMFLKTSR